MERTPSYLHVEVATIRPVPPIAAMMFSEAVHDLRSTIDNMMERNRDQPLSDSQARAVSILIYENPKKFEDKVKGLVKWGLTEFATTATLGKCIASLQPFADKASVPAIPPALSMLMGGPDPASELPLVLLRDCSNEDKAPHHPPGGRGRSSDWPRPPAAAARLVPTPPRRAYRPDRLHGLTGHAEPLGDLGHRHTRLDFQPGTRNR